MPRILGIDPGSIKYGFGIVEEKNQQLQHISHGHVLVKGDTVAKKLHYIHQSLIDIIAQFQPTEAAIERVFVHNNPQSALKLGQARGAALIALAHYDLSVAEYSPREIKKTTTGYGAANKTQIQFMMRAQLKLQSQPQADAADALAIAICHCHHRTFLAKIRD